MCNEGTTDAELEDYEFTPFMDSDGGDFEQVEGNLGDIATRCSVIPSCLGFNTNGLLKNTLMPQSEWSRWTDDSSKGFYEKKLLTSNSPSQAPTSFSVKFKGLEKAYSIIQGRIDLSWNPPIVENDYVEEDVSYDVFVATGEYDFTTNQNIEDLINLFDANEDYQHIEVPGHIREMSINSTNVGQVHTLLITAQVYGVYSTNTRGSKVNVARFSPHIRDEVHIIGIFVPTETISIDVDDAPLGEEHQVTFSGSGVTDEAKSLKMGDYFSGFTSELDSFIRLVLEQVVMEDDLVILRVLDVPLEDIFDQLDLDGVFGISREDNIQEFANRKLFLGKVVSGFVDGVGKVGKAIGGKIEDVVEAVVKFAEFVVTGELEEKFTLLDLRETWEADIIEDVVTLSGGMHFTAEFVIQIRIDGITPDFIRVGVEADYSCHSTIALAAGTGVEGSEEIELWEGKKKSKIFVLGLVPVEAYWQPNIVLELEASVEFSASSGGRLSAMSIVSSSDVVRVCPLLTVQLPCLG
jgi:hypothetical protein